MRKVRGRPVGRSKLASAGDPLEISDKTLTLRTKMYLGIYVPGDVTCSANNRYGVE